MLALSVRVLRQRCRQVLQSTLTFVRSTVLILEFGMLRYFRLDTELTRGPPYTMFCIVDLA